MLKQEISQKPIKSQEQRLNDFKVKAAAIHNNFYNYSCCVYVNATTCVDIICPLHGHFMQLPRKHVSGQKCPVCSRENANNYRILTHKQFICRAHKIHDHKYLYKDLHYKNGHDKITITCPIHGDFKQSIHSHLRGHGCTACNKKKTATIKTIGYDTKWFIDKAKAVHGDKYEYSAALYTKSDSKITIVCPIHGAFEQTAREHLRGYGCKLCGLRSLNECNAKTADEFIKQSIAVHSNRYCYDFVNYVNQDEKITILCKKHGKFLQSPKHHLRGQGCQICNISSGHLSINEFINSNNIKTVINDRMTLDGFEIDIYIPQLSVGIEYNGLYWHSYDHKERKCEIFRHYDKLEAALQHNISLIQVYENEWINNTSIVKSVLLNKLGLSRKASARDLNVATISNIDASDFYNKNHLQGYRPSSCHIGLRDDDGILYSCMSFSRHAKYEYELIRYASLCGWCVRGAASKIFSHFVSITEPKSVLSYADRRYSNGNLYKTLGFSLLSISDPGYAYVKGSNLYRRQVFQKHKLKNILPTYDNMLPESVNMFNNGYRRIWDAGNWKFLWTH